MSMESLNAMEFLGAHLKVNNLFHPKFPKTVQGRRIQGERWWAYLLPNLGDIHPKRFSNIDSLLRKEENSRQDLSYTY